MTSTSDWSNNRANEGLQATLARAVDQARYVHKE
jgi:hypothetical protein